MTVENDLNWHLNLHQEGVSQMTDGNTNFADAASFITQSNDYYRQQGNEILEGHAERDLTRAFAGLGHVALIEGNLPLAREMRLKRDKAMESALGIHNRLQKEAEEGSDTYDRDLVAAEAGVTLHVDGRMSRAWERESRPVQDDTSYPERMGKSWRRAFGLLHKNKHPKAKGYLDQLISHGVPGLPMFGRKEDQDLAKDMSKAAKEQGPLQFKRRVALLAGRTFGIVRKVFPPALRPARRFVDRELSNPYYIGTAEQLEEAA